MKTESETKPEGHVTVRKLTAKPVIYLVGVGLIIIAAAGILSFFGVGTRPSAIDGTEPANALFRLPISELTTQELHFNVITAGRKLEGGNLMLSISTSGLFGRPKSTDSLIEANVTIRYGIDLQNLSPSRIAVDDGRVSITVPEPRILSLPKVEALGADSPGGHRDLQFELEVIAAIQSDADAWLKTFDLDDRVKEQAQLIIEPLIQPLYPDKVVEIEFEPVASSNLSASSTPAPGTDSS